MKRVYILILLLTGVYYGQYTLKSAYLIDPDLNIGYVDSCAKFWNSSWDNSRGGFYTNVGKDGTPIYNWGTDKDMITQGRNAYGYVRAFMMTGDTNYLNTARMALDFMCEHAWDQQYGGWYNDLDINGNPENVNATKTAFYQHYALLGLVAYYEATGDTTIWNWIERSYQQNDNFLWDNSDQFAGYYDHTNRTLSSRSDKSFNATVDAVTTHLMSLYTMTHDEKYLNRWRAVNENILDYLVASMDDQAIGFAEEYNSEWQIDNSENLTLVGHVLKTGWCLARASYYMDDERYLPTAEKLFNDILDNGGYDFEYGAPYKDFDRNNGEMQMWGNPDTAKAWWQVEQAITGGLQMYSVLEDDKYLKIADESLDFFMKYFVDHEYGEIYENRTRRGEETWGEQKGGSGKAGYHSAETGFYAYLYGHVIVNKTNPRLYYNYKPVDYDRQILLSPFAYDEDKLVLSSVKKDGVEYTNFEDANRILNLPAGTTGIFKVEFKPINILSVVNEVVEKNYNLEQNYPNPFNPVTSISFTLPALTEVTLDVYNILGEKISTILKGELSAGSHTVKFNGTGLSSGIYIYTLKTNEFYQTRKMMLIK